MTKQARLALPCLVVALLSSVACQRSAITGEVYSQWDEPLQGVSVGISGTELEDVTDKRGRYSLRFVPGSLTVIYSLEGYAPETRKFELSAAGHVPASKVTLWKYPPQPGIWQLDADDYNELTSGEIQLQRQRAGFIGGTYRFQLPEEVAQLTPVEAEGQGEVKTRGWSFIDSDRRDQRLFRVENGMVILDTHYKLEAQKGFIPDNAGQLSGGLVIRWADLPPGRYAFLTVTGDNTFGIKYEGPFYAFDVPE